MTIGDPGLVFDGRFFSARLQEPHVVRLTRTAVPLSAEGAREEIAAVDKLLAQHDRAHSALLVDVREAPMRNDPAFEAQALTLRPASVLRFTHAAILVRTAVGRLQINRLNERDHLDTPVFMDEAEALAHLRAALAGAAPPPPRAVTSDRRNPR